MPTGSEPISPTPHNNLNGTDRKTSADNSASNSSSSGHSNGSSKLPTVLHDHTLYVQRARVTRPAPPKPSANPMQFVQIKPCNLYQSAQEQLKRAEEVKKVKEVKKEEPEDWQCNLDNWKSSRRKRVEHIIDRVVETKKLEEEEHDRMRRKSKTFSEMMEEKKCSRRTTKLAAILYTEDESNDFSDLGIGTSSASGKSSLSEDYDNQSVMSDNVDNDKHSIDLDHASHHHDVENGGTSRGYTSSPGYDTSSSTAPASSPDPCEYTYEGAIEDYKTRISKAQSGSYNNGFRNNLTTTGNYSKDSTPERITSSGAEPSECTTNNNFHNIRRPSGTKIEDRLMSFEIKSASDQSDNAALAAAKKDLPKVDILKRRELFEKETTTITTTTVKTTGVTLIKPGVGGGSNDFSNSKSIKERLTNLEKSKTPATITQTVVDETKKPAAANRLSGDITSIKDRLHTLEKQTTPAEKTPKIDVPVVSLKDRLSSLHSAVAKEEIKKPVVLIDAYQLEMMKQEDSMRQQQQQQQRHLHAMKDDASHTDDENIHSSQEILSIQDESNVDTDREDSGIHTTDVSCSVSQTDEQPELLISEETHHHHHHHINTNDGLCRDHEEDSHIVALEETIVSDMISVNTSLPSSSKPDESIHLETTTDDRSMSMTTPEPAIDLDASVNEALEIALQAIDSETSALSTASFEVTPNNITDSQVPIPTRTTAEPIYENIGESVHQNSVAKLLMEPPLPAPRFPQTAAPIQQYQQPSQQHLHQDETLSDPEDDQEPYYQVPKKPAEPLYEVPKYQRPIPVYENIEIFYPGSGIAAPLSPLDSGVMEPPKEKPPPPPIENDTDEDEQSLDVGGIRKSAVMDSSQLVSEQQPMKRMNSTKRIKKEMRNKRSSFLGIEGSNDDETYLELTVAPPPDMAQLLQEEKRLEKQLYMKAGLYDSSDTGDSRDSGVSENHSRQSSEPFTNSSEEHEDLLVKKEKEIIEVLEMEEEKQRNAQNLTAIEEINTKPPPLCIENELHEHDEVLRVERELLQLEQEEFKRQRDNLILRESLARHDLGHGAKMLMSANRRSMNDINTASSGISNGHYANIPNQIYQIETDYCKSMSDLHESTPQRMPHMPPPIPPAKPMRTNIITESRHSSGLVKIACPPRVQHSQSIDELAPLRNYQPNYSLQPGNMSRHTLHALSAAPKPKFTDGWVQSRNGISSEKYNNNNNNNNAWLSYQEKRRSVPEGFNCNTHWLVQEAEQRRIEQQRGIRNSAGSNLSNGWSSNSSTTSSPTKCAIPRSGSHDNKPLPDAVIQTLTQRVQSKGIGERRRFDVMQSNALSSATSLLSISTPQLNQLNGNTAAISEGQSDKILSVSGKKKCSHCGEELGRGAAMIIESLRLFYHIDCFKCCVCHIQLSDGLNGTDVRVRNQKLHCQNCYSSDDGIKFSCV